jgi:16S rRNA processing protein RimM
VSAAGEKRVRLGRIAGVHGVKGWVKVFSYTAPRGNIVRFRSWILEHGGRHRRVDVEAGHESGKNVLAKLAGISDRDEALALVGADIAVERAALPKCGPGEYYWTDLEGLTVQTTDGTVLGTVERLMETGAHDVIVLAGAGQRLIPFVAERVVRSVDLEAGVIVVDWDASFWEP